MMTETPRTIQWVGTAIAGYIQLIDQTKLPGELEEIKCHNVDAIWEAIRMLRVRGAPAIGIAAAYGMVLAAQKAPPGDKKSFLEHLRKSADYLQSSRPTAVNLSWAVDRMLRVAWFLPDPVNNQAATLFLLDEAYRIEDEDRRMCRAIGEHGVTIIE